VDYYREMTDLSDVAADKVQALLSIDLEDIGDEPGRRRRLCATAGRGSLRSLLKLGRCRTHPGSPGRW